MTKSLYVIGDPIKHSLSPTIHTLWLENAGMDATYTALHVPDGELPDALKRLADEGAIGTNVTLPHKQAALAESVSASEAASAIGAANTLTLNEAGYWEADNTDAPGVLTALSHASIDRFRDRKIAILGAGGAARAVVFALHQKDAALTLLNRTTERAENVSRDLTGGAAEVESLESLQTVINNADIVINTASAGHAGSVFELPPGEGRLFLDISYGAAAAPQIAAATQAGWSTQDGLAMLVAQAAESFAIWFGDRPALGPALDLCRTIVEVRT